MHVWGYLLSTVFCFSPFFLPVLSSPLCSLLSDIPKSHRWPMFSVLMHHIHTQLSGVLFLLVCFCFLFAIATQKGKEQWWLRGRNVSYWDHAMVLYCDKMGQGILIRMPGFTEHLLCKALYKVLGTHCIFQFSQHPSETMLMHLVIKEN